MSFTLLGILNSQASGAAQAYFLSVLGGAVTDQGNSVGTDSADNVYVTGRSNSAGSGIFDLLFAKYNSAGAIQYQRTLGGAGNEIGNAVAIDSSDFVYLCGLTGSEGEGGNDFLLAKYDSAGTIQWQRILGGSGSETAISVAVDSAGNIYVVGSQNSEGAGSNDLLLAKYNSSGAIQWQRILGAAGNETGTGVAIDSADNVYVVGDTAPPSSADLDFLLAKYDSSGTIQWQRALGDGSGDAAKSVVIDSSDNVYAFGNTASTGEGSNDFLLAKYNSSGTIQWQRILGGAGNETGNSVAIDSSGNIYLNGFTTSTGAGSTDFLISKYDSSGTIQWQRVLGGSGGDIANSIAVDSSDNLYAFGRTTSTGAGGDDFLLAKLPNDGSLEGTYSLDGNNIIYQASSLTAATSSLTAETSTLTAATSSLTSATSTLTDATASLTVVTEEI